MPCSPSLMTMDSDDSRCSASRGFRLREFRLKLNWTQKELADVYGVSRTSVVHWERDRAIPFPSLCLFWCSLPASARSLVMTLLRGL